jgi:hypothetical protein
MIERYAKIPEIFRWLLFPFVFILILIIGLVISEYFIVGALFNGFFGMFIPKKYFTSLSYSLVYPVVQICFIVSVYSFLPRGKAIINKIFIWLYLILSILSISGNILGRILLKTDIAARETIGSIICLIISVYLIKNISLFKRG